MEVLKQGATVKEAITLTGVNLGEECFYVFESYAPWDTIDLTGMFKSSVTYVLIKSIT